MRPVAPRWPPCPWNGSWPPASPRQPPGRRCAVSRLVSLVRVDAITRPDGAPASTSSVTYLRVYATRVTVTTAGRATGSDGITLRLARSGGRWLVSAVLFY